MKALVASRARVAEDDSRHSKKTRSGNHFLFFKFSDLSDRGRFQESDSFDRFQKD